MSQLQTGKFENHHFIKPFGSILDLRMNKTFAKSASDLSESLSSSSINSASHVSHASNAVQHVTVHVQKALNMQKICKRI